MAETSPHKKLCPDCGPATVNHTVARTSIILGFLIRQMTMPLAWVEDAIVDFVFPKLEPLMPYFFKTLSFMRLGGIADTIQDDNIERTKCLWKAAEARGISKIGRASCRERV